MRNGPTREAPRNRHSRWASRWHPAILSRSRAEVSIFSHKRLARRRCIDYFLMRGSTRCLGAWKPLRATGAGRVSTALSDLSGRGACGVCPGSSELKAAGLSRTVSNSPIIRKFSEFRGGVPRQTLCAGSDRCSSERSRQNPNGSAVSKRGQTPRRRMALIRPISM